MRYWYYFWTAFFIVALTAFTAILIVVAIRGVGDLRVLLASLRKHATKETPGAER